MNLLLSSNHQSSKKHEEKVSQTEHHEEEEDEENDQIESIPMLNSHQSNQIKLLQSKKPSKDLWGFYCYSFASEIFSIVAVSLFLPITLEQFARDNGFQYPDHTLPCQASSDSQNNPSINVSEALKESVCEVKLMGKWFDTASFPLYVFSISVAIQAVLVCSLGDSADHPTIRKLLLVTFAGIGSLAGISLIFLDSGSVYWHLISISAIISNVSLGGSLVCLNSFIPSISKNQVQVLRIKETLEEDPTSDELKEKYDKVLSDTISNVSAKGISIGFSAGILTLFVSLIPVTMRNGDTTSLRWAVGSSAIWWALFTVPAAVWLPPSNWKLHQPFSEIFNPKKSWAQFGKMLRSRKRLKHTFYYLMAWFLLSDAYSTITSTAIIFGKTALKMPSSHLILIGIITPATGILGALLIPNLQSRLSYCNGSNGGLKMFKVLIGLSCLIPLYVCSAVVLGTTALTREWELFVLAAVFGVLYGAFQSYARSLFAELIPPGQEAKWYALFSITDKSSSFFGPFIVGAIADLTHNIRYGFLFILLILLISLPLLNLIQMDIGKDEAFRFSEEEEEEEV